MCKHTEISEDPSVKGFEAFSFHWAHQSGATVSYFSSSKMTAFFKRHLRHIAASKHLGPLSPLKSFGARPSLDST